MLLLQGFLAKDLQAEALSKLDHRVKVASEQFMKILEQIDSLVRSATPPCSNHRTDLSRGMSCHVITSRNIKCVNLFSATELTREFQWLSNEEKGTCENSSGTLRHCPISHPHQTLNSVTKGSRNAAKCSNKTVTASTQSNYWVFGFQWLDGQQGSLISTSTTVCRLLIHWLLFPQLHTVIYYFVLLCINHASLKREFTSTLKYFNWQPSLCSF